MIKTAKIYKLFDTKNIYVGHTHKELYERLAQHKKSYNKCISRKLNNPTILLIEKFHYTDKKLLLEREQYYIDKYSTLSQQATKIPHKTIKKYYAMRYKR